MFLNNRYYINTNGNNAVAVCLNKPGETIENIGLPNIEYWQFVECNILEYLLYFYLGINQKVGLFNLRGQFKFFPKVAFRWLRG